MALRKNPLTGFGARALRGAARFVPPGALLAFTRPCAVFFHGVENVLDDTGLQRNHHDRETFIAIARTLKKCFDVLPFTALGDVLKKPDRHSRALFLMSDDGYANAQDTAGILEEIGLPWTLFVSTQHIGSAERNPMFRARAFLRYARIGDYVLPHIGRVDFLSRPRDGEEKRVIAQLKTLPAEQARETLAAMDGILADAGLGNLAALFPSDGFLSWAQLKALAARGVSIGAHAHWHWPMNSRQSQDYLVEQALRPKQLIEAEIGPCTAFAYPFGNVEDVSRPAWQAVRDAGYAFAFTTLSASLDASANRYLLPRHGLTPREHSIASTISLLRAGNRRLQRWQTRLS